MKRNLIILVIFCNLFNRVYGQSASAAIDSLIKFKVITTDDRQALVKELKDKHGASYRVAILGGLEFLMVQKTFHVDPHKTGIMVSYTGDTSLNKKSRDSISTPLRLLLEKINKAGLLTDRVYTYTLKGIDSGRYFAEIQLIGQLTEMSSRLEWLAPNKLLPVVEQLHKNGVVSDSSFLRLQNDINNGKIESSFQLNDYCELDRTFDLTKYPDDPDLWLQQLHHDIASIVPGLDFNNFSYTTIPDISFSIPGIRFKVSLTCNGHIYKYMSLPVDIYKRKQGKISAKDIFVQDFYRIFNKVLADQQSPLRLHNIMFSRANATDELRQFALIALRAEQNDVFMKNPVMPYMLISMENYDNTLTSGRVDSTIAGWQKIGLFAHLSKAQIEKAIEDTKADNLYSMNRLLLNFPRVIYPLDSAFMSPNYPYINMLTHLAEITHGAFNPTKITQTEVKGSVKLQYLFNGVVHSHRFNAANGWLDNKFPAFLKQLSQENNLAGNFYQLPYEDLVIYLTDEQYNDALKNKLIDFDKATHPKR